MKKIILDLIKKYYELGMTVRETIVIGHGPRAIARMLVNRTSVAWEVRSDRSGDEYDDKRTMELLDRERDRIASQLYNITIDILRSMDKWEEAMKVDPRRNIKEHSEKMSWSIRQLIKQEIISPYDVWYLSAMEKEGTDYGYKREGEVVETREERAGREMAEFQEDYE